MSGLLFVSQAVLESWTEHGKIDFQGDLMTLRSGEGQGRSYVLGPAVRFMEVLGTDRDPNALLGKVKTDAQLRALGAEQLGDSVVLGELAYEVEPGFVAELALQEAMAVQRSQAGANAAGAKSSAPDGNIVLATGQPPAVLPARQEDQGAHAPLPRELEEKREEAEALARFLLENLSRSR